MRALESIKLKNFQSHKDALIKLAGPGCLTVITGPSDSGKSAVIRALRWVFYNVPQGDGFIFNAEDKCTVSLNYDDGTTVERVRSRGGINRYHIYDSASKQGQVFEGFGTGVPVEVQQATGIRKLEIGDQSFLLNLSEQLDGPFLGKSVSGPARAKVLGKLAGTEEIDYAHKEIGTDLYRAKRQQESLGKDVDGLDEQLSKYGFILGWARAAGKAEAWLADTRANVEQIEKLKVLSQQWKDLSEKVLALKKVIDGLQSVDKGLDSTKKAQDALAKVKTSDLLLSLYNDALFGSVSNRSRSHVLSLMIKIANPMIEKIVEKNTSSSTYTGLHDRCTNSSLSVMSLKKSTERLAGLENVVDHLRKAFTDNVQLLWAGHAQSRYEDSQLCVLSLSRVVKMFVNLKQAEEHLNRASEDDNSQSVIGALSGRHERSSSSFKSSGREVTRYSSIDEVNKYLDQAFMDNLRQLGVIEAKERRMSLVKDNRQREQVIEDWKAAIKITEAEYIALMSTLGKCPTCGNEISIKK